MRPDEKIRSFNFEAGSVQKTKDIIILLGYQDSDARNKIRGFEWIAFHNRQAVIWNIEGTNEAGNVEEIKSEHRDLSTTRVLFWLFQPIKIPIQKNAASLMQKSLASKKNFRENSLKDIKPLV